MKILLEASPFREPTLKELDKAFSELKKDPNDKKIHRKIERLIKEFTGIKRVIFQTKKIGSASVLTFYNGVFFKKENVKSIQKLKQLLTDDKEKTKYIYKIIVNFNPDFIKKLTGKQMTAVLLHELGHVYAHSSHLWHLFLFWVSRLTLPLSFIYLKFLGIIPVLLVMRSLDFLNHREEYNCDEFANKYGYGDELAAVFAKFTIKQEKKSVGQIVQNLVKKILFGTSHPSDKKRVCRLVNDSLTKYKHLYPEYSKELILLTKKLKCEVKT